MWLTAPENDYRSLLDLPAPEPSLAVTVCMPVYNRVDLLARTVAGLVDQSYPRSLMSVAIGDDGSEEDVEAAVAPFRDRLEISVLRRERDGYGAGQARNLAARHAAGEILVFVDSDCVPDRDLVARHAVWHHLAENLVVIGSRHGIDTSSFTLDALADGRAPLRRLAFGTDEPTSTDLSPTDYRGVLHRRTADTRHGDEAFRSLVSSNFSMRRDRFLAIGGFDETFHRWGGEDIELGWRCHVNGLYTVPDDRAVCYHQLQEDLWEEGGRQDSARLNAGVIQNKIPHHFYRRYRRGRIWEVPKVSVVITPVIPERLDEMADHLLSQSHNDWEMVFPSDSPQGTLLAEMTTADPRFRGVDSNEPLDLLGSARGEYVVLLHGAATPEPSLLRQAVRRLDMKRRDSRVTTGYLVGGEAYRHADDASEFDTAWDLTGQRLPVFDMIRRREWSKAMGDASSFERAHEIAVELSKTHHLAQPLVALRAASPDDTIDQPLPAFTSPRARLLRDLYDVGPRPQAVKVLANHLRSRERASPAPPPSSAAATSPVGSPKPTIRYVGWTGKDNLGDEALLHAVTELLDWGSVQVSKRGDLLLLGGGTLINREPYLDWLEDNDSPRTERAVLGTGVANPDFWGKSAESTRWKEWLGTCAYLGVRGPRSAQTLADWGVEAEVVGDAALLFEWSEPRRDGLVVVSPCRTRNELWGGSDEDVIRRLTRLVDDLGAEGRPVSLLAAHPDDDGPCLRILQATTHGSAEYLAGYDSIDGSLALLASADLVVAERLHAAVLAAAVGTPFVGLEYRPKVRDFAASLDLEDRVLRTDELDGMVDLVWDTLNQRSAIAARMLPLIEGYRTRLRSASALLRDVMTS